MDEKKLIPCCNALPVNHVLFFQLAGELLGLFDPTLEPEPEGPKDLLKLIPCYNALPVNHVLFFQLAGELLGLFDPTLEPEPEVPKDLLKLIPMYRNAKVQGAYLPGKIQQPLTAPIMLVCKAVH